METRPFLSSKQKDESTPNQHIMMENHPQQSYLYDSTATGRRGGGLAAAPSSKPSGRGKSRFIQRQQMKLKQNQQKIVTHTVGIYNSIFPSKRNITSTTIYKDEPTRAEATPHSQLYTILNPKGKTSPARLFQNTIASIIILDAIIYIISTEPKLQNHFHTLFYIIEGSTSTIFLLELIARLKVCTEKKCYAKYGPILGRWRYMYSFQGIDLPTLTYLRVFRLIRITRTRSYTKAVDAVGRVLYFNREILHVAALLGLYLVVVTSVLMYYLRPRGLDVDGVDDISDFESIGSTMVLSILMLTGQGGPSGKLPWYTQAIVLLTGMFSVAMFAIPASDISTSDEEYMNIIGAEDEDEDVKDNMPQRIGEASGRLPADSTIDILQSMQTRIEQLEMKMRSRQDFYLISPNSR
eukprot:scaffold5072_cov184-Skeletonema_menzelii.AAC.4